MRPILRLLQPLSTDYLVNFLMRTYIHAHAHTSTCTHTCTYAHTTQTHTTHTHIHTHTQTHTQHTHTHTYTHTQVFANNHGAVVLIKGTEFFMQQEVTNYTATLQHNHKAPGESLSSNIHAKQANKFMSLSIFRFMLYSLLLCAWTGYLLHSHHFISRMCCRQITPHHPLVWG